MTNPAGEGNRNPLEPEQKQTSRYFPALDGLRALAVCMVFMQHYTPRGTLESVATWGWTGVQCFFVLSGFLITGILWDSRGAQNRLRSFYARRALRILPLYYGVWVVIALLTPWMHWKWSPPYVLWILHLGNMLRFTRWPASITPASNDHVMAAAQGFAILTGHLWSLCVEEQFYLVWPWLVYRIASLRRLIAFVTILVLSLPVVRLGVFLLLHTRHPGFLNEEALYRLMPFQADGFGWGALLALSLRSAYWREWVMRNRRRILAGGVGAVAVLLVTRRLVDGTWSGSVTSVVVSTFGFSLLDFASVALILWLIQEDTTYTKAFLWSPLRRLGIISYGFYVLHDLPHLAYKLIVARSLSPSAPQNAAVALLAFSCTWVLSELSFRFYETPFLRLKARWTAH